MAIVNECIPFYDDGEIITGQATAAVTGKRFLKISGDRTSGPGLATTAEGGNYRVAPADAGGRVFGVASYDVASGAKVPVITGPGTVVPVTADGAISAGDPVSVGAAGKAKTATAQSQSGSSPYAVTPGTIVVGLCLSGAADGADAEIKLH